MSSPITTTATAATELVEQLQLGAAFAAECRAADAAIVAARASVAAVLFPGTVTPVDAGTLAELEARRRGWSTFGPDRAAAALQLHARSLATHPALAAQLRTFDAVADVGRAAGRAAAPMTQRETIAAAEARVAREAMEAYQRAIAEQLAAAEGHELAPLARDYLALEGLAQRLVAARARHTAHAQAELARIEEARQAAERARAAEAAEASRKAATEASQLEASAKRAAFNARRLAGEELAAQLRASGRKELRVGPHLTSVEHLAATAPAMSYEQIAAVTAALAAPADRRRA